MLERVDTRHRWLDILPAGERLVRKLLGRTVLLARLQLLQLAFVRDRVVSGCYHAKPAVGTHCHMRRLERMTPQLDGVFVTDRRPFRSCRRRLTVALLAALSFDTRVELIWMSPLSVSGGIGSSQKGSLRARIRTDYYLTNPHKVADRRKPAPMDGPTSR
jgi:hypothetical protein